ncbi:hypothetical protein HYY74_05195 [Candidatus Woesearchaeota archaeon]|nr:hypothetical protein [Candidatus Woesearchaeota archaeon]
MIAAAFLLFFAVKTFAVTVGCQFSTNCPTGNYTLLYVKNDTAGYLNAHAQLSTNGSYPYSLCCNTTVGLVNNSACAGNTTLLNFSAVTNAHVQAGNTSAQAYGNGQCISTQNATVLVYFIDTTCPVNYTAIASISNDTNAHIGDSAEYTRKVCLRLVLKPSNPFTSPTFSDNTSGRLNQNSTYINLTVTNETDIHTILVNWNGTNVTVDSPDLLLSYSLDLNATDSSRYGQHGSLDSGAACGNSVPGKIANACTFDGVNAAIGVASPYLNLTDRGTIMLWFNSSRIRHEEALLIKGQQDTFIAYGIDLVNTSGDTRVRAWIETTGFWGPEASVHTDRVSPNVWYHVTVTWNSTNMTIYINGLFKNMSKSATPYISKQNLQIGSGVTGWVGLLGQVDEVRIWNRTLSSSEINASYLASTGKSRDAYAYFANFTDLAEGNYTYYVWLNDSATGTNRTVDRNFIADFTAPTISGISATSNSSGRMWMAPNSTTAATIWFNAIGTEGDGQNVTIQVSAQDIMIGNLSGNTTFSEAPRSGAATPQMYISYTIEANSTNSSTLITLNDTAQNSPTPVITWANDSVDPLTIDDTRVNYSMQWYNAPVNITLNVSDVHSGANRSLWCVYTAGTAPCAPGTWNFNKTNWVQLNCSADSACSLIIRYYSVDNVTNNESGGANGGAYRDSNVVNIVIGSDINYTVANNSNISKGSFIRNSILWNTTVSDCTILASNITKGTFTRNSTHRYNCTIERSVVIDSNITSAVIRNSYIDPSVIVDSVVENSNITSGTVFYSRVENTTFCAPSIFTYEAIIRNETLISGLVTYNATNYYGPYPMRNICSGSKPEAAAGFTVYPTIVNNTGILMFKYVGYAVGMNISINKSELKTRLFNSTINDLILKDNGDLPDEVPSDGTYTANLTLDVSNNMTEGVKTLLAYIDDGLGNRWNVNVSLTLDNTSGNASVKINSNLGVTTSRNVLLDVGFNDTYGIDLCRFSNEERDFNPWEACTSSKAWRLSGQDGAKTVILQVRDRAGNINETNDTITLSTSEATTIIRPVKDSRLRGQADADVIAPFGTRTVAFKASNITHTNITLNGAFGESNDTTFQDGFRMQWNTSLLADGLYNLTAISWDNNNIYISNYTVMNLTIDNLPPQLSAPLPTTLQRGRSFIVNITVNEEAACKYDFSNATYSNMAYAMTEYDDTNNKHSAIATVPDDAYYTIYFSCTDQGGSANTATTGSFQVATGAIVMGYVQPTDDDKVFVNRNYTLINLSVINSTSVHTALIEFNGTNITLDSTNLLLAYDFNNNTIDRSRYGNNGVNERANCTTSDAGKFGYACNFDGLSSQVRTLTTGFSNSTGAVEVLINMNNVGAGNNYTIFATPSEISPNMSGLVGLWHFEQNSTAANGVKDSSIYGQDGNATSATYVTGRFGGGWDMNQAGSVDVQGRALPTGNQPRTVMFWVYLKSHANENQEFFIYYGTGSSSVFTLYQNPSDIRFDISGASTPSGIILNLSRWEHIAVTYASQKLKFYKNGRLFSEADTGNLATATNTNLQIGGSSLNAIMDEVAIFNRSLSEAEIRDLYLGGLSMHKYSNDLRFVAGNQTLAYTTAWTSGWNAVAGSYNETAAFLYVDGNEVNSTLTREPVFLGTNAHIGGMHNDSQNLTFNGSIDELRVWSRRLTYSELNVSPIRELGKQFSNLTGQKDGNYTYYAYVNDTAGNKAFSSSRTVIVDTVIPTASVLINSGLSNTTARLISLSITANDTNGGVQCRFSNEDRGFTAYETCSDSKSWSLSTGDGTKTVVLQARDKAGNVNETNDSITLTAASTTVIIRPTSNTILRQNNTIDITTPDATLWVTYNITNASNRALSFAPNGSLGQTLNDTSPGDGFSATWMTTGFADGTYNFTATSYGAEGQLSSDTETNITIDNTPPSLTSPQPTTVQGSRVFYVNVTTNEQSTCKYDFSNVSYSSMASSMTASSTTTYGAITTVPTDGYYTIYYACQDKAGNTNTATTGSFQTVQTGVSITYTTPTDDDKVFVNRNYAYINLSISNSTSVSTTTINWNGTNYSLYETSTGLVGLWHLDNSTADSSVMGNNGTNNGADCSTNTITQVGKGCSFDGTNDYLNTTVAGFGVNQGTIMLWTTPNFAGNDNQSRYLLDARNLTIFIQEGTTNYVTNPSFEVSTGGWTSQNTPYRVNNVSFIGNYSLMTKGQGSGSGHYITFTIKDSGTYTLSMYAKMEDGSDPTSRNIAVVFQPSGYGFSWSGKEYVGNGWYRLSYTATLTAGSVEVGMLNYYGGADKTGQQLYIDGVQLEPVDHATGYADGTLGPGYVWSATAHSSNTTRAANTLIARLQNATYRQASANISIWQQGQTHHIAATYDNTTLSLYVDGVLAHNASGNWSPTFSNGLFIGTNQTSTLGREIFFNGTIDEVAIYNKTLTTEEINRTYMLQKDLHSSVKDGHGLYYANITNLTNGNYTYSVYANDSANNKAQTATRTVIVDTINPTASILINSGLSNTTARLVSLSITANDTNGGLLCRFANEDRGFTAWETCSDAKAWSLSTGDGLKQVVLQARDRAGNINETNDTITLTAASTTVIIRPVSNSILRQNNTIDVTTPDATLWVMYNITNASNRALSFAPNGSLGQTLNDTSPGDGFSATWMTTGFTDGTYNLTTTSYAAEGQLSTDTETNITIDNTPPQLSNPQPTTTQGSRVFYVNITTNEQSTCKYDFSNVSYSSMAGSMTASSTTTYGAITTVPTDGYYTIYYACQDKAGNTNTATTGSIQAVQTGVSIAYTSPTDDDRVFVNRNYSYVNLSIANSTSIDTISVSWNGTNVTIDDPSLVLALDFNNNTNDRSRYGNNGNDVNGANCLNTIRGRFGTACSYNGLTTYVNISNPRMFDFNGKFTVQAWVNLTSYSTGILSAIVGHEATQTCGGSNNGWALVIGTGGKAGLSINNGSTYSGATGTTSLNNNTWYQITGVFDGVDALIYVNGVLETNASIGGVGIPGSCTPLWVGAEKVGTQDRYFNGTIDEVRIWNRSLSYSEINASYTAELGRFFANQTFQKDGNYSYYAYANDTAGNKVFSSTRTVIVDTVIPTASILINSGLSNTTARLISLSITANDTNGGLLCRFANEDRGFTAWETCSDAKAWSLSTGDGTKTVVLQARDRAGNVNETNDSITYSATGPTTILRPLSSSAIRLNQTLDVAVPDAALWVTYNITNASNRALSYSVNGTPNQLTNDTSPGDGWSQTIVTTTIGDGVFNLTASSYSIEGLISSDTETNITIDNTVPQLSSPLPTTTQFSRTFSVNVTTTEKAACHFDFINATYDSMLGRMSAANTTSFRGVASVATDGTYAIYFACQDAAGNTNTATTGAFFVNSTAPVVTASSPSGFVNAPANLSVTTTGVATCHYSQSDVNFTQETVMPVTNGTSHQANASALYVEGRNTFFIRCAETATGGNAMLSSITVAFTYDTRPPVITGLSPANNSFTNSRGISFSLRDTTSFVNRSSIMVWFNNSATGSFSQASNCTENGLGGYDCSFVEVNLTAGLANNFTVLANDSALNLLQAVINFTYDTAGPGIVISSPLSGAVHNTKSLYLNVTLGEPGSCRFARTNTSYESMPSGFANSSSTAFSGNILADEGSNTYYVSCRDRAGNEGSNSTTFQVNTTAPVILNIGPNGTINNPGINLSLTTDDTAYCSYSQSDINYSSMTAFTVTGAAQHQVNVSSLYRQGVNVFFVRCADTSGGVNAMSGSAVAIFTYDTSPPAIASVVPSNGSRVNTKIVSFSLRDSTTGVNQSTVFTRYNSSVSAAFSSANNCTANGLGGFDCSFTEVNITAGLNNITLLANDSAGNSLIQNITFTYDTTGPAITINSPVSGSVFTSRSLFFNVSLDEAGFCRYAQTNVSFDSMPASFANVSTTAFTARIYAEDGSNTYYIRCKDIAGNENNAYTTFQVNTTPPVILNIGPNGTIKDPLNLSVTTDEVEYCAYSQSDVNFSSMTAFTNTGAGTHQTNVSSLYRQGVNVFFVRCADTSGGVNAMASSAIAVFTYDTSPPVIASVVPSNGSRTNSKSVSFSLRDSTTGVNQSTVFTRYNSSVSAAFSSANNCTANGLGGYDCSFTEVNITAGLNNITILANDSAGNSLVQNITFTYDTTGPAITIDSPVSGAVFNTRNTYLNISLGEAGLCRFAQTNTSYDNMPATLSNTSGTAFTTNLLLAEGSNTYYVHCKDIAGNENNGYTTVTANTTAPVILNLAPNGTLSNPGINVSVTTDDVAYCSYSQSDINYSSMTAFTVTGAVVHQANLSGLYRQGVNTIFIRCADTSGGVNAMSSSAIVQFTYDTSAPVIANVAPVNNSRVNAKTVSFSLRDSTTGVNLSTVWMRFNNSLTGSFSQAANCTANGLGGYDCSFVEVNITAGLNNITVLANDSAGNSMVHNVNFTYDITGPAITIDSPVSGSVFTTRNLFLNVSLGEAGFCRYANTNVSYDSMAATFPNVSAAAFTANVQAVEGGNAFYVHCKDAAGNENNGFTTFQVNTSFPVILNLAPNGSISNPGINVSVTTDDVAYCAYSQSDVNFSSMTAFTNTGAGTHQVNVSSLYRQGTNIFFIRCADTSGGVNPMQSSAVISFYYDSVPPVGAFTVNDSVVKDGDYITFRFEGTETGINVTLPASELSRLDFNGTRFVLNDSGTSTDSLPNDGIYAGVYRIAPDNNVSDGVKTLTLTVNDSLNNTKYFTANVTLDNTKPNASIQVNFGATTTSSRSAGLNLVLNDSNGIDACRFSNEDRSFDDWETCTGTKGWVVTSGFGVKTVVVQVRDQAGNVNETNDTINLVSGAGLFGVLTANDSVVADGNVIKFIFEGSNTGLNASFNSSEIGKLDFNSTELGLDDSGQNGDFLVGDGLYTGVYTIAANNNVSDGVKTLTLTVNDTAANYFYPTINITLDNTPPNGSVSVNGGATTSITRSVALELLFNDSVGIEACRFANENREFNDWEACTGTKGWLVSAGFGTKTVVFQTRDKAGNVNESNDTIILTAAGGLFGTLKANDTIVANGAVITFTFDGSNTGLNASLNSSELAKLDSGSTALILNDSGLNGDVKVDDALYTGTYTISADNSVADGTKTIVATVNDTAGNRFHPGVNITLDNTKPNASVTIRSLGTVGIGNATSEYTGTRAVMLLLGFNDSVGIHDCRYANEDLVFTPFEPCSGQKGWMLTEDDGNKTVIYEVRDYADNINRTNDTILLNKTGAGIDATPPLAPTITDDGKYTNTQHMLHARWNSTDPENEMLHIPLLFEYRISYNSSSSFVNGSGFLSIGPATEISVFGLSLDNNTNYTFEIRAINSAGSRSDTGKSDGIIVDITPPSAPNILSNNSNNWTSSATQVFNWSSNDTISGVKAYSYILDSNRSTLPDSVEESETEHTLMQSAANTGQQQALKYNSTGNASTVYISLSQNISALDVLRVTVYAVESHVDSPDLMKMQVYAVNSVPTSYNMTNSNITTISNGSQDVSFKPSISEATGITFTITASAAATAGQYYVAVQGVFDDDDNSYNLLIAGSNSTIDNTTQAYVCLERASCTNQTASFEYAIQIEQNDVRADNVWDRTYGVGDGTFYFHVKALDNAGTWSETTTYNISVDSSAPSTPQMAQPIKVSSNSTVYFEWTQSTDPQSGVDNYFLAVDNDSDFSSTDYSAWVGNRTNRTVTVTNTSTTYYARVHSKNQAGVNSSRSDQVSTILDITAPAVTYIRPRGTVVMGSITIAVETNERATCKYAIGSGAASNFTFTNTTYHETEASISNSDTITVTCSDSVNNQGTASSGTITVSALTPDSITMTPSTKTVFTDEPTRIDATVKSGSTNLGGLATNSFNLLLDGINQDISVTDNGQGNYSIIFRSPKTNGSRSMVARINSISSSAGTLSVEPLFFTVQFVNSSLSPITTSRITYSLISNFSIGIATQSRTAGAASSSSYGLNMTGNARDSDVMIFVTAPTSGVEKTEDLLKQQKFLDTTQPAFARSNKKDTFVVFTELGYDNVAIVGNKTITAGRHNIIIENKGFDTTINKTKLEVRVS